MSKHRKNGNKATPKDHAAKVQQQKLLDWFFKYGFISTRTAYKVLDIIYASARIYELKKKGWNIETVKIKQDGHNNISEYHLVTKSFIQCDLFEGGSHE